MGRIFFLLFCVLLIIIPQNNVVIVQSDNIGDSRIPQDPHNTITVTSSELIVDSSIVPTSEKLDLSISMAYPKVAMVKPVFTAAAYSGYYVCYAGSTSYKSCFDKVVPNIWSTSSGAVGFINSLLKDGYPASNIITISDIDVHNGAIFDGNGQPKYDSIVFFHNEYVTLKEYHNTVNFMKAGGNVIILNGNAFFAEVIYDESTNRVKLVSGHGWNFDGENGTEADVYKSRYINGIYNNEHQNWFGSRYTAFGQGRTNGAHFITEGDNPHPIAIEMNRLGIDVMSPNYNSHEENSMITQNAHIIADWEMLFVEMDRGIKIYEIFPEGPTGGSLIHFGFFGTDVLANDYSARKTFVTAVSTNQDIIRILG